MQTTIPKKETIDYLIQKCYKKFPELLEMIPEEEVYNRLNSNISKFIGIDKNKKNQLGGYVIKDKIIIIYGVKQGKILETKKETAVHESIHALFRRGETGTGCHNPLVRHFGQSIAGARNGTESKYTGNKSLKERIKKILNPIIDSIAFSSFGKALNEGFTEWCTIKCGCISISYISEVSVMKILENVLGTKEVLKIGNGNHAEIAEMLNLDMDEYKVFMTQLDKILFLSDKIENKKKADDKDETNVKTPAGSVKEDKKNVENDKFHIERRARANEVANTLVEKIIKPHYDKEKNVDKDYILKLMKVSLLVRNYLALSGEKNNPLENYTTEKLFTFLESNNYDIDELSAEECEQLLLFVPNLTNTEELWKVQGFLNDLKNRKAKVYQERFSTVKSKIQALREEKEIINIYEVEKIMCDEKIWHGDKEKAIASLFDRELTDEEKKKAVAEFVGIISAQKHSEKFGKLYVDLLGKNKLVNKYFTEENGFSTEKIVEKGEKHDEMGLKEIYNYIEFMPDKESQKEPFFAKFANMFNRAKKVTLNDIINAKGKSKSKEEIDKSGER